MPIKVNNSSFLKVVINDHDSIQAVGLKYRASVDKSKCFAKFEQYFCTPSSQFTDYRTDQSCISSIFKNKENIVDKCNIREVKPTGDIYFFNLMGHIFIVSMEKRDYK